MVKYVASLKKSEARFVCDEALCHVLYIIFIKILFYQTLVSRHAEFWAESLSSSGDRENIVYVLAVP